MYRFADVSKMISQVNFSRIRPTHLPFSNIAKFNLLIFSRSQYIYCVCYSEVTVNYRRSANLLCLRETKVLQIADYIQKGFLGFAQFFAAFV